MTRNYNSSLFRRFKDIFDLRGQEFSGEIADGLIPAVIGNDPANPVLVTNIQSKAFTGQIKTVGTTSGTGWFLLDTVPSGKRRKYAIIRVRLSTGTWTFTDIGIEQASVSSQQIPFRSEATGQTAILFNGAPYLELSAGDKLYIYINSHTTGGNAQIQAWYVEYDDS